MKTVTLLHNPKAGGKEHTKGELVELIEKAGYKCLYFDVKKNGWDKIAPETEFLAIAGGDGTIRKVIIKLFENKTMYPVALIPLGTANNISKSLNITGSPEELINSWKKGKTINFDIGRITGPDKPGLLLEGFGVGVFPELIHVMEKAKTPGYQTPEEEMETAIKTFSEICKSIVPVSCTIEIDGKDYSGDYILAEIMNIRSIGTNFDLNPAGSPSDGIMEVILIPEFQRNELAAFIQHKSIFNFTTVKAKHVRITWKNAFAHIDDQLTEVKAQATTEITIDSGLQKFIVP
ncbi:MAG TPA: diacylglycerol kinase family protein [Bacteroidia bacterium]|nr:diacylglycerol kinase family protein [Bacteroidia bacterium]